MGACTAEVDVQVVVIYLWRLFQWRAQAVQVKCQTACVAQEKLSPLLTRLTYLLVEVRMSLDSGVTHIGLWLANDGRLLERFTGMKT